jgi:hypothetical protein
VGSVVSAFVRNVFAREPLGLEPASARRARRAGMLRLLLAPEPLPSDPPAPPRRRGRWLAWLFAPEPLDPP